MPSEWAGIMMTEYHTDDGQQAAIAFIGDAAQAAAGCPYSCACVIGDTVRRGMSPMNQCHEIGSIVTTALLIGDTLPRRAVACPADRASCTRAKGMGLRVCTCGSNDHDRRQHDHDRRPLARHDRHQRQAVTTGRTGHDHGKAARTLRRTHHNGLARLWPTDPCNPPDRHARRSPAATGTPCVPPCGPRRKRYCDPLPRFAPSPQGAAKKSRPFFWGARRCLPHGLAPAQVSELRSHPRNFQHPEKIHAIFAANLAGRTQHTPSLTVP